LRSRGPAVQSAFAMTVPLPHYTPGETVANAVTHGLGLALSIAGLVVLSVSAARTGNAVHVVAAAIFGAALILCFTTSTLYHAVRPEHVRRVLRALDHSAIFVLIAGTYTPFMLSTLRGLAGWTMLVVLWTLAVVGIAARLVLRGRRHNLVVACYLAMGWSAVLVIKPLVTHLPAGGLALLVAGGMAYTVGVIFYKWKSLPYSHAIWHAFVLAGSALHYFAVLLYVIPDGQAA
jgi:hemolysin III